MDDAPDAARRGVHVLRGLLIWGLVVTAGPGAGGHPALLRAALPLLAGLGFATALGESRRIPPRIAGAWALHVGLVWLSTFAPVMLGSRDIVRTCAVAGGIALLLRSGRHSWKWLLVAVCLPVGLVTSGWLPEGAYFSAGHLKYAVGVAWPRGWAEVGGDALLFLTGCWAARGEGIRAVSRLGGVADALGALGRMPLTTALGQVLVAWLLVRAGGADGWTRPILTCGVLVAQTAFARGWLRERQAGPAEHVLYAIRMFLISLRTSAWKPRAVR